MQPNELANGARSRVGCHSTCTQVFRIEELHIRLARNLVNADRTLELRRCDSIQYHTTVGIVIERVISTLQQERITGLEGKDRTQCPATHYAIQLWTCRKGF